SGLDYRLAIAEDGSSDGTGAEIDRLRTELPGLIVQRIPQRVGRGKALRTLWSAIDADIYAFMDADLPTDPLTLVELVRAIEEGADVVTGSRYCAGAIVHRPPVRSYTSLAYNGLVRFLFQEPIRDHQCGLKAFRREALAALLPASREDSWAWDTEMLVLAVSQGFRVVEIPVDWTESRYNRTPVMRLLSDVYLHGSSILRLLGDLTRRFPEMTLPTDLTLGADLPPASTAPVALMARAEPTATTNRSA
ncbi:MAG: glycosyltransferase, partial [Thermoplasmata archaeon]|nr:glycosyltransferase [Thermoplasmata archaeon]